MWRHYVYVHRKADTGQVFYVGKGTIKRGRRIERPYERTSRNQWWQRVVSKHGFLVELIASCLTDQESQRLERELIAFYGRKALVNMTDGGDGHAGIIVSEELRRKRSINSRGKRSPAWVEAIRIARKNGGNGGVVKHGDHLPQSWCDAIAKGQRGPNNYMRGRVGALHPNSRKVVDRHTGQTFDSVLLAAEHRGVKMKTLYNWLSGHRPNPTALEFA